MGLPNITIGTPVAASDGKTYTIPLLTGGSPGSGYTPASGVTGITVTWVDTNGNVTLAQTSATISGTNLTVVTTNRVSNDLTVKFALSAASNISDSGGNTATGQTDVAADVSASTQASFTKRTTSGKDVAWIRNSDHKTISLYFTPTGSGGYQGSTTTGWTITVNGVSQAFTASSGGQFTLTSAAPAGASVVVAYDATVGNARDNNNIVLQSFTTADLYTSFPINATGVVTVGNVDLPTGTGAQQYPNNAVQFWFTATGTDLMFVQQGFGTAWIDTVDGVDGSMTAATQSGYVVTPVFNGASDTSHTVKLIPTGPNAYLDRDDFFLVKGSAPSIGADSSAPVTVDLHAKALAGATDVRVDGSYMPCTVTGVKRVVSIGVFGEISLRVTLSVGRLRVFAPLGNANNSFKYSTDGGATYSATVNPTISRTGDNVLTIATGLTTGSPLDIRIMSMANAQYLTQLLLDPGDVVDGTALTWRPTAVISGNSITAGVGSSDSFNTWPRLTCVTLGYAAAVYGVSGSKMGSAPFTQSGQTPSGRVCDLYIDAYGTNDITQGTPTTADAFQSTCSALITHVQTYLRPTGRMVMLDIWPSTTGWFTPALGGLIQREIFNARKRLAVAKCGDPRVVNCNTDRFFDVLASGASPHPSDVGVLEMRRQMPMFIAALTAGSTDDRPDQHIDDFFGDRTP